MTRGVMRSITSLEHSSAPAELVCMPMSGKLGMVHTHVLTAAQNTCRDALPCSYSEHPIFNNSQSKPQSTAYPDGSRTGVVPRGLGCDCACNGKTTGTPARLSQAHRTALQQQQ